MSASVVSVSVSPTHSFSKKPVASIRLISGLGVEGDSHFGPTVQHRSRLHINPPPPNLRQVHLIPAELFSEIATNISSRLRPGDLGENVTTKDIDLKRLSRGTRLRFTSTTSGDERTDAPTVIVTGLRNPCPQIDKFQAGLKEKMLVRDDNRKIVGRLAGVMATVENGGVIRPGMKISVEEPAVSLPLECV
ncbi:pyruvate kinase-like protein [Aspergillus ambiguus]|uniref:MOSC domain-containing protein n=1 Tax=Aspergillus ambiguus TaxID=176160 RepID=UPI003CCD9EB7